MFCTNSTTSYNFPNTTFGVESINLQCLVLIFGAAVFTFVLSTLSFYFSVYLMGFQFLFISRYTYTIQYILDNITVIYIKLRQSIIGHYSCMDHIRFKVLATKESRYIVTQNVPTCIMWVDYFSLFCFSYEKIDSPINFHQRMRWRPVCIYMRFIYNIDTHVFILVVCLDSVYVTYTKYSFI